MLETKIYPATRPLPRVATLVADGYYRGEQGHSGWGIPSDPATLHQSPNDRRNEADVTTAVATSAALTAADRCDRCGAQAYLRVELQSGGELLFCAHHAREHGDKLKEIAVSFTDETHKLAER